MQDHRENSQEPSHPDGWYGPFYFAPKDSRTIVPRRGPGSTVNVSVAVGFAALFGVSIMFSSTAMTLFIVPVGYRLLNPPLPQLPTAVEQ